MDFMDTNTTFIQTWRLEYAEIKADKSLGPWVQPPSIQFRNILFSQNFVARRWSGGEFLRNSISSKVSHSFLNLTTSVETFSFGK